MKEKLMKLLYFDKSTSNKKYSHIILDNKNVLFAIEDASKDCEVEVKIEFTPEEFEIIKKLFDIQGAEPVGFIRDGKQILSKEDLEKLGVLTILPLAQDLEHGLVNAGTLNDELTVLEYLKYYFIPHQSVTPETELEPVVGAKKRFIVDLYYDEELKRYAVTDIVEADCIENIKLRGCFHYFKAVEDVELEQPALFSASISKDWEDGHGCDHHDYIKTIYVLATSFKEGTDKLKEKFNKDWGRYDDYRLNRVCKESGSPLEILLRK